MRKVIVVISLGFLISCSEVSFKKPQPKGVKKLTSLPSELVGKYVPVDSAEATDTLVISRTGYVIKSKSEKPETDLEKGFIGDSLVVKFYKGYYFINRRENDQWILRLIKSDSGYLSMAQIDIATDEKKEKLKAFNLEVLKIDGNTYYQINPSKKELLKLVGEQKFEVLLRKAN